MRVSGSCACVFEYVLDLNFICVKRLFLSVYFCVCLSLSEGVCLSVGVWEWIFVFLCVFFVFLWVSICGCVFMSEII